MKIKQWAYIGALIALSILGAFIKIPSAVGSLAFDAVPGFMPLWLLAPLPALWWQVSAMWPPRLSAACPLVLHCTCWWHLV
ncbi:MAG: hypothetical protein KGZ64_09005 [Thermaerobacter sp.]|nr:hypothetical protein [Thermaerobacter sp.]